jgi:adenylylsulfate kinase-like enzyme
LDVLIARDAKGLYQKALRGEIDHFTGISDPYEQPLDPELVIDTSIESPEESAIRVWSKLRDLGLIRFEHDSEAVQEYGRAETSTVQTN